MNPASLLPLSAEGASSRNQTFAIYLMSDPYFVAVIRFAYLLSPFADIPLERVLKGGVVVQLEEVGESAEIVEEEAEGDETGNKVFQFDARHSS